MYLLFKGEFFMIVPTLFFVTFVKSVISLVKTIFIGRQFDKSGNLKQWWDDEVIAKFKDQAMCIIEQYGNYTMPEVAINVWGYGLILSV